MSQKEDIKTLLEAGAHFGHRTSRWNPEMKQFIYTKRGGIHIIDLVQTAERLKEATEFTEKITSEGKQVLFVGTKKHIAPAVQAAAVKAGMPYVTERWFGGILTNFDTISDRIKHYKKLVEDLKSGELEDKYNKREIGEFQEEKDKLALSFGGIAAMEKLPGALFVADVVSEQTAIREAVRLKIPVIGIVDTNADPRPISHPVPANDDAVKTVELIAGLIAEAAVAGTESHAKKPKNQPPKEAKKNQKQPNTKATAPKKATKETKKSPSSKSKTGKKATKATTKKKEA